MNHIRLSALISVVLVLLAACAPAPIADSEVLALQAGQSARTLLYPEVVAVMNGTAIHARPIASGNGAISGWGVTCGNGNCGQLPANFITAGALSQWFNQLARDGWQIYTRASAVAKTPVLIPITPELLDQIAPLPQS